MRSPLFALAQRKSLLTTPKGCNTASYIMSSRKPVAKTLSVGPQAVPAVHSRVTVLRQEKKSERPFVAHLDNKT